MELQLLLKNVNTNVEYDITDIAEPITVTQTIDGNAGKLTCILQKDPNNLLQIANGSLVTFNVNGQNYFQGYVFKIGTDADENYKITCYDQLRYFKNNDTLAFENMTASDIFADICKKFNVKYRIDNPTDYIPASYSFLGKSLYAMVKRGMDLANSERDADGQYKHYYYIINIFDTLVWKDLTAEAEKLEIDLGENSITTSFTYEKSIDSDTYTQIKFYRRNNETGNLETWTEQDSETAAKWGILQYLKQANDKENSAQVRERVERTLSVKNRETETLKLTAEGILECRPGVRVGFKLDREKIDKAMWIRSATHKFTKYSHTMDLELEV